MFNFFEYPQYHALWVKSFSLTKSESSPDELTQQLLDLAHRSSSSLSIDQVNTLIEWFVDNELFYHIPESVLYSQLLYTPYSSTTSEASQALLSDWVAETLRALRATIARECSYMEYEIGKISMEEIETVMYSTESYDELHWSRHPEISYWVDDHRRLVQEYAIIVDAISAMPQNTYYTNASEANVPEMPAVCILNSDHLILCWLN